MEVAVTEVPSERRAADAFPVSEQIVRLVASGHRSMRQGEQGPAVCVHRAEGVAEIQRDLQAFLAVDALELGGRHAGDRDDACLDLGRAGGRDAPQCGVPIACVVAHSRQERDLAGKQVARHHDRRAHTGECEDKPEMVGVGGRDVRVADKQEQQPEDHEDVPLQRHAHRDGTENAQMEDHHHGGRDGGGPATVREEEDQGHTHLDHRGTVRHHT